MQFFQTFNFLTKKKKSKKKSAKIPDKNNVFVKGFCLQLNFRQHIWFLIIIWKTLFGQTPIATKV